ncbi:ATP-binding protein [Candidatus Poribacteria bacterium]|nr:ATP-binding protein [Candidatus Poribacteria bacterium]
MRNYLIESFKITKLWGYRDIDLIFNRDVNCLIGVNGSGKTTILNLLYSILSGDLRSILNINFQQAKIGLRGFQGKPVRTIKVDVTDEFLKFKVGQKPHNIPIDILSDSRLTRFSSRYFYEKKDVIRNMLSEEIDGELTPLVPLVWLPISRRLPVTEDEEEQYIRREGLESVDLRLKELLAGISRYHSILNAQLSERYGEFERQVLSVILYSKNLDRLDLTPSSPTEVEKVQLLGAFEASGLLNSEIHSRIDDHFAAVERVVKRITENPNVYEEEDILVLPLISRTKDMVEFARKLEQYRKDIFAPLHLYEDTVNSFLKEKTIKVDESDGLKIESSSKSVLNWRDLSSGEKQILILLTQALLKFDEPVVYIADEPELSLHVTWQGKLLESLVMLGGQKQIIVATHSPDIVGKFQDKVIDLGRAS